MILLGVIFLEHLPHFGATLTREVLYGRLGGSINSQTLGSSVNDESDNQEVKAFKGGKLRCIIERMGGGWQWMVCRLIRHWIPEIRDVYGQFQAINSFVYVDLHNPSAAVRIGWGSYSLFRTMKWGKGRQGGSKILTLPLPVAMYWQQHGNCLITYLDNMP